MKEDVLGNCTLDGLPTLPTSPWQGLEGKCDSTRETDQMKGVKLKATSTRILSFGAAFEPDNSKVCCKMQQKFMNEIFLMRFVQRKDLRQRPKEGSGSVPLL